MPINSQKTFAFKERLRIGREIAAQLDPVMSVGEVAKQMGLSKVMVRRIECLALHKISVRMKQIFAAGEDDFSSHNNFEGRAIGLRGSTHTFQRPNARINLT